MNKSLCQQLANGLKDPSHSISARSLLNQQPEVQFAVFRSDLANILGCHVRAVGAKGALCMPQWRRNHLRPLYPRNAEK